MAKLHFKYATMNSGKSIDLMRTVHNYEELGFKVLVIKPKVDTKGDDCIESRVGLSRKVDIMLDIDDEVIKVLAGQLDEIKAIFIDEVQFLTPQQIDDLFLISKVADIPVICYGLRNNFMMEAFDGSKRLLEIADVLEEITTLCGCGKIARFVGRKKNGIYENDGPTIVIDGTDNYDYEPLCGDCYLEKVKQIDFKKYQKKLRR
ncbi:MAG: thymidine kinase [Bacilli bacterium]|nr:thymidine kinase [Bacilli bacterium]